MRRRHLPLLRSARDRDRLRQEQLERLGWRFHRIWSAEWFHDKDTCTQNAIAAYHAALRAADEGEQTTLARDPDDGEPGTLLQTADEAALSRTTPAPQAPGHRIGPRPWIIRGQPIEAYSDAELLRLAQWIRSDDILRTQDELLQEMMRELGFQRRGKNVVVRLTAAITQTANAPGHHGRPRRLQAEAAAYRLPEPSRSRKQPGSHGPASDSLIDGSAQADVLYVEPTPHDAVLLNAEDRHPARLQCARPALEAS